MNRLKLRLSIAPVIAILLLLAFSAAASAQVSYTLTGTLTLVPGDQDPLGLSGTMVTANASISQTATPSATSTTTSSSSNTYTSGVTVTLSVAKLGGVPLPCSAGTTPALALVLTDNVGAPDTIAINNCSLAGLATLSANATIPTGFMISDVPAAIPSTSVTGNVTANSALLNLNTAFTLAGTLVAAGTPPPTVTPNPTAWTPTAAAGSTTSLTQPVTFTSSVANSEVSFTTSASTTPAGQTWLSVSPAAANTASTVTITANPTGLAVGVYHGTVTLSYGSSGVAATTIPVTFTITGPTLTLTGPASMTFGYTIGTTPPASQTLNINTSPASSTSVNASVTAGGAWLSVTPNTSTTPASFTVSVNTTGLTTPQTLTGNIQITASNVTNSPLNIPVNFTVSSSTLTVPTTPLIFNYTIGGTAPTAQSVNITGTTGISFTTSVATTPPGGLWLSATPSGTVPSSVSVSINTASLTTPGTLTGSVTVTSTGAAGSPAVIPITLNVTGPTLTVSQSVVNFSYQIGSTAPAAQPINVGGTAGTKYTVAAATTTGGAWLGTSATTGTTPGSFNITVNTTPLTTAGSFTGTVTVAATGATSQVITVNLTVTMPTVTATPTPLSFAYQIGTSAPSAQTLNIGGTSGLSFTAAAAITSGPTGWLSVTPTSGTVPTTVSVSINTSGLTTAGTFKGTITVAAPGATSAVVPVTLVVSASPTISASPSPLSFAYQIGSTKPPSQTVNIGGTAGLSFTAAAAITSGPAGWLSVNPTSGTTPASVSVSINTSVLTTAGTFKGTITITASGASNSPISVPVTITVSSSPTITVNPTSLTFKFQTGGTAPAAQPISISGSSALSFTAAAAITSGPSGWLAVTPTSGTTPQSVSVSVNTAVLPATPATYQGTITITASGASNSPQTINVTLTVTAPATTINLSTSKVSLSATAGSTAIASQTVNVTSTPVTPPVQLTVATDGGTWLSAFLSTVTTPGLITVAANPSKLAPGTYLGAVIVTAPSASNSPLTIAVTFTVSPQTTVTATPSSLNFAFVLGGSNPAAQSVNVTSSQPATISAAVAGASWLSVNGGSSSATPAALSVSVNPASLPVGTYQATVSVTGAGVSSAPQVLPVTLVVSNKPMLAPSPSSLTFAAAAGSSNPSGQTINLAGSAALPFTVSASPSWLGVSAASGSTPSTLVATVNTKGMPQGSYQGAITITSATAGNGPITIPVTLNLAVPLVSVGPFISSIVNGASYDTTGFSPGAIVSIFGSLLGPKTGSSFAVSNGVLGSTLAGVTVTVEGVPAIPLFAQDGQVNVILPYNIGTSGQANVQVEYNNLTSAQFNIPLTAADVQLFTADNSGTGPGSILNQDFSVNSAKNPAAPGSVVSLYGTGGGAVNPGVNAGGVAGDNLSRLTTPYSATVNGEAANVTYAGTAPGLVYGVYQFNVQLPADVPSGSAKIVLTVGDSTSQPDVTVFVK